KPRPISVGGADGIRVAHGANRGYGYADGSHRRRRWHTNRVSICTSMPRFLCRRLRRLLDLILGVTHISRCGLHICRRLRWLVDVVLGVTHISRCGLDICRRRRRRRKYIAYRKTVGFSASMSSCLCASWKYSSIPASMLSSGVYEILLVR